MHRSGQYITQQSGYKAFVPKPLPPEPPIVIDEHLQELLREAELSIGKIDVLGSLIPNHHHILAMYVRKEALLSSQIEGTQASLEDIFQYENHIPLKNINDVQEVVNYIKAFNHGMERLEEFPMSIRLIKEIHSIMLEGTRGNEKEPGEFRRSQNWIGSPGSTLKSATFVPPPPQEVIEALGQLELFLHEKTSSPLLINCALIHYQFETIHPFLDGNGRLGRLLIAFFLHWKGLLKHPLLYMSYFLKIHRQEYYDRLNLVRERGDFEQWIVFFLKGIKWTAESALETIKQVLEIKERHKQIVIKHLPSVSSITLLDYLLEKPHVSIKDVAVHLKLTNQAAQNLVNQFLNLDLLKEITERKRNKRYSYWEYIDCLSEGT